jgi:D-beta-D-heptose 7-phosphate kinase/D-beta-D-heptose 1-phosphate adenosyltransferase
VIFDIKSDTDLPLLRAALSGKEVGLTSGSFDLFHHLHLVYLLRCRRLCEVLLVGVDSNDLVFARKGPGRPLVPEHQRVAIVSALSCVHAAFIMGSVGDFGAAVDRLDVAVVFKNQAFEGKEVLGADRARLVIIPDVAEPSSTTQIIEQIRRTGTVGGEPVKRERKRARRRRPPGPHAENSGPRL